MVPSSAKVPCMIGKAKSSGWNEPSASSQAGTGRVGDEVHRLRLGGVETLGGGGVEVAPARPSGPPA